MVLFGMQRSLEETTKFADAWLLGWLAVIVGYTPLSTPLSSPLKKAQMQLGDLEETIRFQARSGAACHGRKRV